MTWYSSWLEGEPQISLQALMGTLQDDVGYGDLKKKLERLETGKGTLATPLPQGMFLL